MTYNEFKKQILQIPDLQTKGERRSGGVLGLYVIFAKWKNENEWIFVRAYETAKGLVYMLNTIEKDIFEKQDFKILHLTGDEKNYVNELLIVESENDDTA